MSDDGIGMGFGFKVGTGEPGAPTPKDGAPQLNPVSGGGAELPPPRVLVVANLRGHPAARDGRRVRVDPGALDEAIAAMEPALYFVVPDLLLRDMTQAAQTQASLHRLYVYNVIDMFVRVYAPV